MPKNNFRNECQKSTSAEPLVVIPPADELRSKYGHSLKRDAPPSFKDHYILAFKEKKISVADVKLKQVMPNIPSTSN